MNELLSDVVRAHGGLSRWRSLNQLEATVILGGEIRQSKGHQPTTLSVVVDLHRQYCLMKPLGSAYWRAELTSDRIALLNSDGSISEQCLDPQIQLECGRRDALCCAYFDSCVLSLGLTTPFLLVREGVTVNEIEPYAEEDETWSVLRAEFAPSIATHSRIQDFYFGDNLLMRRHDYEIGIAGGLQTVHLFHDYDAAHGIRFPRKHRAYATHAARNAGIATPLLSVDVAEISFR